MTIVLGPAAGGLAGQISYNTDLFEKEPIERLQHHLGTILSLVGSRPDNKLSQFSLLTDAEKQTLLKEWSVSKSAAKKTSKSISRLFEEKVAHTPNALVFCGQDKISYRDLNARANQTARLLVQKGVQAESIVGIYLERSIDLIVSMMAVLKAGGVMLPLDPDYPADRIFYMLHDSGAERVIVSLQGADLAEACV